MILYCKDSLGFIDNNNIKLINNIIILLKCLLQPALQPKASYEGI